MNHDRLERIIEEALLANRSAIWWQSEMNSCLRELEELEQGDPYGIDIQEDTRLELEERMEYLIQKGQWEDQNLDKIMRQMNYFAPEDKRHIVSEITKRWDVEVKSFGK